jgi:indolepyruvate ferredoxin oxidoreductase beta subunit
VTNLADSKVIDFNVLIAGVGGQGNLLSSEVIATAAVYEGFKVRVADVFGAAQRGGSVLSHIRLGEEVYSPIIRHGGTNVLLGLEPVECLRASKFLSSSCIAIVNTKPVYPRDVSIGETTYPSISKIVSLLRRLVKEVIYRDFTKIAEEAGNSRSLNLVMVGSLAALELLPIGKETFLKVVAETVPKTTKKINLKAFQLGYEEIRRELHQAKPHP